MQTTYQASNFLGPSLRSMFFPPKKIVESEFLILSVPYSNLCNNTLVLFAFEMGHKKAVPAAPVSYDSSMLILDARIEFTLYCAETR
jgi:hypothetical protein